jgi:hypothetical protein
VTGVVVSLFVALAAGDADERMRAIAVGVASAVVAAVSWAVGRPSAADRARRDLYRAITAVPVDPALLPEDTRRELGDELRAELGTRAPTLAPANYREIPAWEQVALDPAVTDDDFLRRAAVLARIESRDADASVRARLARVHDEACRKCHPSR